MGDHFELLVDRLLTESTLEAALESRNRSILAASSAVNDAKIDLNLMKRGMQNQGFSYFCGARGVDLSAVLNFYSELCVVVC